MAATNLDVAMASVGMEADVLVSRDVEASPARRAGAVTRVVVATVAVCSMLGLLGWICSGGAPTVAPAAPLRPTPSLAYVPTGMVPFKKPMPARQRLALPLMQSVPNNTRPRAYIYPTKPAGGIPQDSAILVQGGSLRTWTYRSRAVQQVQVVLSTEGRSLDADLELWHGPEITPTKMRVYLEDGQTRPFRAVIETPGSPNAVAIRNIADIESPMAAQVLADDIVTPSPRCQSSSTTIQGMALRTYSFDRSVDSVQVLIATDGRPLNARIELLQGPNNIKQVVELYAENGAERPFFAILETPGVGNVVRVVNTAPIEFLMNASVVPDTDDHEYAYRVVPATPPPTISAEVKEEQVA